MEKELFLKNINNRVKRKLESLQLDYFFDQISCDTDEINFNLSAKEILKSLCIHWNGASFYFNGTDNEAAEIFFQESKRITKVILEIIKKYNISQKNSKGGSYGKI